MRSTRSEAPYLPSNVKFVAANNGGCEGWVLGLGVQCRCLGWVRFKPVGEKGARARWGPRRPCGAPPSRRSLPPTIPPHPPPPTHPRPGGRPHRGGAPRRHGRVIHGHGAGRRLPGRPMRGAGGPPPPPRRPEVQPSPHLHPRGQRRHRRLLVSTRARWGRGVYVGGLGRGGGGGAPQLRGGGGAGCWQASAPSPSSPPAPPPLACSMCIYPMNSPGGYQLIGRTLPIWNAFTRTGPFEAGKPWLLRNFDQARVCVRCVMCVCADDCWCVFVWRASHGCCAPLTRRACAGVGGWVGKCGGQALAGATPPRAHSMRALALSHTLACTRTHTRARRCGTTRCPRRSWRSCERTLRTGGCRSALSRTPLTCTSTTRCVGGVWVVWVRGCVGWCVSHALQAYPLPTHAAPAHPPSLPPPPDSS